MMEKFRNLWPLCMALLFLYVSCFCSEARHHSKHPSAVIVGAVFCDTCFQNDLSKATHYISGATVAVQCAEEPTRKSFYQEVKTDKEGKFKVELPFSITKHVKKLQGCNVKLVKSSEPYCSIASTSTSSLIHLKQKKGGKHIFSAGFFTFKPLKQPNLCNQPITQKNILHPQQIFSPILPPVLPAPQGPLPTVPNPFQPAPLLPNPFQPPAPPLIPNPFQPPSPPASMFPPLPPLPSVPIVPGLIPTPTTPPPASFLPPIVPLPPVPLIPGIPPKGKKLNP